jgi:hypothetical protein
VADGAYRYKLLAMGPWGSPPRGVPYEAQTRVEYALTVLQRNFDLCHGAQVRWFDVAGSQDWDGDPGVFVSAHPLLGCVDPKAPTEARLNVALTRGPTGALIRTTVHEALHVEELARGLQRHRTHAELEQLAEDVTALLCRGVP